MNDVLIRPAVLSDAEVLLRIYSYYVLNTAVSFEEIPPSVGAFKKRVESTLAGGWPYLVAERGGVILGFAYAGALNPRSAYRYSCEMTVYLDPDARGAGVGTALYTALEEILKKREILNLYACIASPEEEDAFLTNASERFHEHMGYRRVGTFHRCGFKFDRWYNMIWMEKMLAPHPTTP